MNKKIVITTVEVLIVLAIISVLVGVFSSLTMIESLRVVYGSVYVLFLPGFVLSFLFFPKTKARAKDKREKGSIDWIERIALSFALSIAIVPLVVFYLNLVGIKINTASSFLTVLVIVIERCHTIGYQ